jgi:pimeloyl-ACP methyl ester carboxylesterase/predicted glycosyltransferase
VTDLGSGMAVPARGERRAGPAGRAPWPDAEGVVDRDGVPIAWEVYGSGSPTVLLLPTWSIVHSRVWKMQIPFLARHLRVVCFDGRGNGRSGRPRGAEAYSADAFVADTLAVMDGSGTDRAALVALSRGALWATELAAEHPERVERVVYIAPAVPLAPDRPERSRHGFEAALETTEGWAKYNARYWEQDYEDFLEFFFAQCFSEAHSTKPIEDAIGWALETSPQVLADTARGMSPPRGAPFESTCARVRCPVLVIHGDDDRVRPHAQGAALAAATRGQLVTLSGSGHLPEVRDPVRVNRLLHHFVAPPRPGSRYTRAPARPRRALFISSPIGLGHVRRDLAIARELRRRRPGLQIDWLAQHPVTAVLDAAGEHVHPASAELASESAHIAAEADGHRLPCFEALRRMDEILVANFMVFHDLVTEESYDVWIGDEAWELDYFLHEHPELKSAAYAWLSDFVGYLPMPEGGAREVALVADLNAEMLEQVARYPRVRDRSIFVGDPEDIVDGEFGPGLPGIRTWTEQHFDFCGYITDVVALARAERAATRSRLGYGGHEPLCVATVGGSGVGSALLRAVIDAVPAAREQVPDLRVLAVAGPRIDPAALGAGAGIEVAAFLPDLPELLAVCDLAIVQGGLATTMELTAARRPFIYVPLDAHFEQNLHVAHRLRRHGAGRRMAFAELTPDGLAAAIREELGRTVQYRPVPAGAAAGAAARIAELL